MYMAIRYIIVCLLLVSCAQVKPLEGGPVDMDAPVPYGIAPKNGTVNFSGHAFAITFNEYVKLNNPIQSIQIIPNDAKIKSELKDKTLLLYWEEDLRENTTYSIFLNKAIKDISESNDSIMQIVFSTGPFIDSLSYSTFVLDAKDGNPRKNVVVGLFDHPDSIRPIYYAQTDTEGKAVFSYLKEGDYYVRAFDDASKQGKIGKNDGVAFKEEAIRLSENLVDSSALKMFVPLSKPKVTTFQYISPGSFVVGANRSMENAIFKLNDTLVSQNNIKYYEKDSVLILSRPAEMAPVLLSVSTESWQDSSRLRIARTRNKTFSVLSETKDYFVGIPIILSINDQIDAVDTSFITLFNLTDSTTITDYSFEIKNENELSLLLPKFNGDKVRITLKPGAIIATGDWSLTEFTQVYTKRFEKEFGILNVKINQYTAPIVLELLFKNKVIKREQVQGDKIIRFDFLEPGEYSFRIIVDSNNNGEWDTGSFDEKIQAEAIHLYSKPTKVRANWEIEVELEPNEK